MTARELLEKGGELRVEVFGYSYTLLADKLYSERSVIYISSKECYNGNEIDINTKPLFAKTETAIRHIEKELKNHYSKLREAIEKKGK